VARHRKPKNRPQKARQPGKVRAASAAVFLVLVLAAAPAVMLAWGRVGAARAAADDGAGRHVIPPEGGRWAVELSREDGDRLLDAFFSAFAERSESPGSEADGGAEAAGGAATAAPVFVTIYAPGVSSVRACGRGRTVADGVRDAAAQVRARAPAGVDADTLRVRIDVLQEAVPFPEEQRMAFARREIGPPTGVALQSGGRQFWFLPADFADGQALANEGALTWLCRQANLDPARWRTEGLPMWRLEVTGFVDSAPGGRYALESPRGLGVLVEPTIARLLRACRLGAAYLLRGQQKDGRFVTYRDAVTGLHRGCETVTDQVAVAGALSMLAAMRPDPDYAEAAYRSLSFAMSATDTVAGRSAMAITHRQEVCTVAFELETSAQVLEALCRYRAISGMAEADEWIDALAEFQVSMQRDDGLFDLARDARTGERSSPGLEAGSPVPQAKAIAALLLAYRERGAPKSLAAAGRALAALRDREVGRRTPLQAREARWLAVALREAGSLPPDPENVEWMGRIAAGRRKAQLLPDEAPAADLVGATLEQFPPAARTTADDLVVFASACMMDAPDRDQNLAAARRAAAWLMHVQYLPENSYYLSDPGAAEGGLREWIGGNGVRVQTLESALRGMAMLAGLQLKDIRAHDREG
jgi:hypothetical protein